MSSSGGGRLEIEHDGRTLVVAARTVVVGRQRECALRVRHPLVSREHCRFDLRPDGLYLNDLGSMNGTYLNGSPVGAETRLRRDDRVGLGRDGAVLVVRAAEIGPRDLLEDEADLRTIEAGDDGSPTIEAQVSVATQFVAEPESASSIVLRVRGRELTVPGTRATFGRSDECDVVLDDGVVSRRHCEIEVLASGVAVRDLASRHGVWVGDRKVDGETVLRRPGVIGFGRTGPRVEVLSARVDGRAVVGG